MSGRHRLKRRQAVCTVPRRRRTVEVVDVHTFTIHFLTMDALAAGRHPKGRYIALCGQDVLPAGMTEPGHTRCPSCVSIPPRERGRDGLLVSAL